MSQTSDTTSQTSFLGDSICAEPVSDYESDGAGENHTKNIAKETISAATTIKNVYFETHTKKGGHKIRYVMPGVGTVVSPRRMPSLRDHAPVFQVIYSHPGESMMQEGFVYIFKHMERPNLFKIGFSTKGAEERWRQSKCYGTDTEIIYETKRKFRGARQAEKIIQTWLCHQNVLIKSCVHCGGGHKEWFEAPREDIFKAVEAIEAFVQMPAYVQTDGVWKLSAEAYKIVGPMCHFDPPALLKGRCAVEKENKEAESPQVTPDATPSKDTEEADICENSDATGQNTLPKPPGDGGEVEEDSVTALIRQLFGKLQISVKAALEVKAEWTL
ncbi:hypothetical protein TrVGV298_011343 [Trichoderma virens]|nr:hypothetical protein TrVGV298_011343 [Trichoderma virens]